MSEREKQMARLHEQATTAEERRRARALRAANSERTVECWDRKGCACPLHEDERRPSDDAASDGREGDDMSECQYCGSQVDDMNDDAIGRFLRDGTELAWCSRLHFDRWCSGVMLVDDARTPPTAAREAQGESNG